MTSSRLLFVSTAPCLLWALVVGCGEGGGFRGATLTQDDGDSGGVTSGTGGGTNADSTSAGSANAGAAGIGGASGGLAGGGGDTIGAGAGGEIVGAGQAGMAGAAAGSLGTGGVAGEASGGVSGSTLLGGGGAGGGADSGGMGGIGGAGTSGTTGGAAGTTLAGSGGMNGGMSGAGSGGQGGASGGSAGAGGSLGTCAERCNTDADCRIFGTDQGYRCNPSTHRCETFAEPCRSSLECLPESSFWIFDCTTDADCFFFSDDLCVDVGGVGRCARLAPSANGCAEPNVDEVTLPRFGATGSVLVCANATLTCFEGECVPGCRSNTDCTPARNGSVCDVESGLCRCVADADCGGLGVSHCNTATGRCECSDSRDCDEVSNANTCAAGRCGCAAVSACNDERTFSGTSYVCE